MSLAGPRQAGSSYSLGGLQAVTGSTSSAPALRKRCREAGILIGVGGSLGNVVRLQPPLVLTEDEAAQVAHKLAPILRKVDRSL